MYVEFSEHNRPTTLCVPRPNQGETPGYQAVKILTDWLRSDLLRYLWLEVMTNESNEASPPVQLNRLTLVEDTKLTIQLKTHCLYTNIAYHCWILCIKGVFKYKNSRVRYVAEEAIYMPPYNRENLLAGWCLVMWGRWCSNAQATA